jgi:hypothetical protein
MYHGPGYGSYLHDQISSPRMGQMTRAIALHYSLLLTNIVPNKLSRKNFSYTLSFLRLQMTTWDDLGMLGEYWVFLCYRCDNISLI